MTSTELRSVLVGSTTHAARAQAIVRRAEPVGNLEIPFRVLLETGQLTTAGASALLREFRAMASPDASLCVVTPRLEELRREVSSLLGSTGSDGTLEEVLADLGALEALDRGLQTEIHRIDAAAAECRRFEEQIARLTTLIKETDRVLGKSFDTAV